MPHYIEKPPCDVTPISFSIDNTNSSRSKPVQLKDELPDFWNTFLSLSHSSEKVVIPGVQKSMDNSMLCQYNKMSRAEKYLPSIMVDSITAVEDFRKVL